MHMLAAAINRVSITLSLLLLVICLYANAQDATIKVSYRHADRINEFDELRRLNILKEDPNSRALRSQSVFLADMNTEKIFIDWALSLGARQSGLNVSVECGRQLESFVANLIEAVTNMSSPMSLFDEKNWSIRVIDSFGKLPSGILNGGFNLLGDYSECVGIRNKDWQGKYCQITNDGSSGAQAGLIPILFGICLPEVCNSQDIESVANTIVQALPDDLKSLVDLKDASVRCQETYSFDGTAISAVVIVTLFGFVVAIATAFDVYQQHFAEKNKIQIEENVNLENLKGEESRATISATTKNSKAMEILLVFSVYTNSQKLFDISSKSVDQIDCINAIRVITLSWVILCHCYSFLYSSLDNKIDLLKMDDRLSFKIITSGFFSVDTFFLLSGFLTSYLFLKEMKKPNAKVTPGLIFKYYFHRYWRLTPVYAMCMYMSIAWTPYTSNGPFHNGADGYEANRCRKSWWTNLLYINNMGIYDNEACFGEAWYLANDMQYHWLSPLLLIPLTMKNKKYHIISFLLGFVLLFQSFLSTALILHANPESAKGVLGTQGIYYFTKVYTKPWTRIQPFIVGVFLAYILSYRSTARNNFKFNWVTNVLLWLLSLFLMCLVLFGMHNAYSTRALSVNILIIYESFSRFTWSLGLAGVIFLCYTSNGYFINGLLSLKVWRPLARLNYCVYLVHVTVIFIYVYNQKRFFYISDINMVWFFLGTLSLSFVTGYVISLLFEIPFIRMEKFFFKTSSVKK